MPAAMDFVSTVRAALEEGGFHHYGWAPLDRPLSIDVYREWLREEQHGSMQYLAAHAEAKAEPRQHFPRLQTAIVVAQPYLPHPYGDSPLKGPRLALYAQGEDYHLVFLNGLRRIQSSLKQKWPNEEFLCFTDSGPILERDLAYRAGVGWVGKNTCLIDPERGSLFFLGQILTSRALTPETPPARPPLKDFCGTCDRCLRACPTGAIEKPRWLNATKCISYWTIEAREAAPLPLREQIGDWFFGCDICQLVCPWNLKAHGRELLQDLASSRAPADSAALVEDLRWILGASHRELARTLGRSPLARARPLGLKRNALVVIGNLRLVELLEDVVRAEAHPRLKEVATWTRAQLT